MKFRYLVVFAALAFMASCSNEENVQVASVDDDAWVYDESLPVPVTFAAPHVAVQSKAAMTNETFKTAKIGLWGLSNGTEAWNATVENSTVLIPNAEITLVDGQIQLENEYYPMDSKENFSFYGYYPYGSSSAGYLTVEAGRNIYALYRGIGDIDILYAAALAEDREYDGVTYEGFNAKYIRAIRKNGEEETYKPKLEFKHVLTGLDFVVKKPEGASDVAMTLKALSVLNVANEVRLTVASKHTPASNGTLTGTSTGNVSAKQSGNATLDAAITEEGVKLDRLMLVPGNQYQISLTVNDGVKDNVIDENLIVKLPEDAQFEAGKYYTLEVLVNSPEEVSINVVYTDWVEGGQGGSIEI